MKKKIYGFTLIEIMVALIIISITLAGILATFIAGKRHTRHAIYRLRAMGYGRQTLDMLKNEVRQDFWNNTSSPLYPGPHGDPGVLDEVTYSRNHTVSSVPGRDYRKVQLEVRWSEPTE